MAAPVAAWAGSRRSNRCVLRTGLDASPRRRYGAKHVRKPALLPPSTSWFMCLSAYLLVGDDEAHGVLHRVHAHQSVELGADLQAWSSVGTKNMHAYVHAEHALNTCNGMRMHPCVGLAGGTHTALMDVHAAAQSMARPSHALRSRKACLSVPASPSNTKPS